MSENQEPFITLGGPIYRPPADPEGTRYRQADALAIAALNAVDPTAQRWAVDPIALISDVVMLMAEAQQVLFERARGGYPDRREPMA